MKKNEIHMVDKTDRKVVLELLEKLFQAVDDFKSSISL